jgi:hypothetical protein
MKLPKLHPDPRKPHLFHDLYFVGAALMLAALLFAYSQIAARHESKSRSPAVPVSLEA